MVGAPPSDQGPLLRSGVWEFMRPLLSPTLAKRNRDSFVDPDSHHHRRARALSQRLQPSGRQPRGLSQAGFHGDWVRWVPRSLVLLVLMLLSASMSP